MKKWLFLFSFFVCSAADHAVTYGSAGRLGDQLLCYLHAKWLSYQYGIPLLYKPFQYSNHLKLDSLEVHLKKDSKRVKRDTVILDNDKKIDLSKKHSRLYTCLYFPEDPWDLERGDFYSFKVNWKEPQFRKIALEMICPKVEIELIDPQKNRINIALHVREGGGYDDEKTKQILPLKLPPMSFYTDGLNAVLPLLGGQIYCRIFTDAKEPEKIVQILQDAIAQHYDIVFDYRKESGPTSHVLEDFFSLFNFDVLIRPQSNFSIVPSLLHDFAILYFPTDVGRADMQIDNDALQKVFERISSF